MPASFPASVKTFTTKLDGTGNPINSAHINDIQDEVNAIEAGYLNATARLNSSASTLASLDVTGGSTLEGRLQVTGASTFTLRPTEPPPDCVLAILATTNAMGSSANSTLSYFTNSFITNSSIHSTAAGVGNQRFTPQSTGVYTAIAQVNWSTISSGYRQILLEDSSAGIVGQTLISAGLDVTQYQQCYGTKRFDVLGGYLICHVAQALASTLSNSSDSWLLFSKL